MSRTASLLLATVICLSGCATQAVSGSGSDRNRLTAEDLALSDRDTAHDAITRLRPTWLRTRGASSITIPNAGEVVVFVDSVRFGGPESLHNIRIADIREIQYLSGPEATTRFGTGVSGGVIHVMTR